MADQRGVGLSFQHPAAVAETDQELFQRHRGQSYGGQLDRQRDAIELTADLRDRGPVLHGDPEPGTHRRRAFGEQRDGREVRLHRVPGRFRGGQRRDRPDLLPRDPQYLPAGGQHPHPLGGRQQRGQHLGAVIQDVLTAVDNKQQLPILDIVHQLSQRPPGRTKGEVQTYGHRVRE